MQRAIIYKHLTYVVLEMLWELWPAVGVLSRTI